MPDVGDPAPAFQAVDSDGQPIALSDFAGRNLVLYFYPKDDTPGCTTEACEFRDNLPDFAAVDAEIVGVSKDSVRSHRKFADKFELPFRLLSDEDQAVCQAYDVIQEKSMYGKKYLGIERTTYLIDGEGVIRARWPKVQVKGHVAEVLQAVKGLGA
jgi:peroxiredoxin Q/BCP